MPDNSMPNDPMNARPTDMVPRRGLEDIPMKQAPQAAQPAPSIEDEGATEDSAEIRQEETLTFRYAIGKLNDFLQWFASVLEVVLFIRFILKLIGADPTNLFAGFLYSLTDIILYPFSTIVRTPAHQNQVFEWSTLIAMIIYWLIFWAIRRFLRILISGPEEATG